MSKKNNKAQREPIDKDKELNPAVFADVPENQNQNHNIKKQALGPNTKR
ncbi:MAG: hypothetical protein ACOX7H_04505 [Bacillota bacterium]